VSALANYRLNDFSVERPRTFLNALDQDIEIVIRKKRRSQVAGRISIALAGLVRAIADDADRNTRFGRTILPKLTTA
jgi:hypothetical protein